VREIILTITSIVYVAQSVMQPCLTETAIDSMTSTLPLGNEKGDYYAVVVAATVVISFFIFHFACFEQWYVFVVFVYCCCGYLCLH